MEDLILKYPYDMDIKLNNFEKYVRRQALSRFLARYELFKLTQNVKGSIVEAGVHYGGGLLAWAKIASALDPYGIHRKVVIGFDTFSGFPGVDDKDVTANSEENDQLKEGGFNTQIDILQELNDSIEDYNNNRFLDQFPKVELVKGDVKDTIPEYLGKNQHLIISLLYLDFDLYDPTKIALKHLLPRMPKGACLAFDEINNQYWPGETLALLEEFGGLNNLEIKKFPFDPNIAYIIL